MKTRILALLAASVAGLSLRAQVLLDESFNYPDGQLSQVATNVWVTHSGGERPLNVSAGAAVINQADFVGGGEDVNRALSVAIDPSVDNSTQLYAAFWVNFSSLPVNQGTYTSGSYFAHFKSTALNEFYARLGANSEGAAPGMFRLAIANETWTQSASIEYPMDLALGVTYEVVIRLDLATDQTTLWINPQDESSPSVTATDPITFSAGTLSFALRQGTSGVNPNRGAPGILSIDNLRVATTFAGVIPEPSTFSLLLLGGAALLARRRQA